MSNGISTTEYQVFDKVGRVTQNQQTTDGETYNPMTYKYNLSGAMTEQKYPSGRIVKNVLDNDGMLSMIQSKKDANSGYFSYAKSFRYNATGAVESMQLGNGKWESTTFNSRLQPTQIALGTVQNGTDKLKLDYTYGTTNNNGNVQSQAITVERSNQSPLVFNQSYVYDELNRLKSAEETSNNATTWKQTYNFDRYGNRTFDTTGNNTTTLGQNFNPNIANPSADESNNRFTTSQGYVYDLNGNLIEDASGRTFIYDGENKQKEAKNSSNQTIGTYFFDGEGKRVKKETPTETIIFIYDASSKLVAEYSTEVSNEPKVQYLTEDNLGTPRIVTDKDGDIISRSDYMPYGEEIIGYGNRTATDNYESDDVRQGFTGYEKDDETGLDYAQARMYNNALGRFTGADPLLNSGRPISPNTWNRYAYVLNNPLNMIDPTGLYECQGTQDQCEKFQQGLHAAQAKADEIKKSKKYGPNSKEYLDAQRAIDAYNEEGVVVTFGQLDAGTLGTASGAVINGEKKSITITIDLNQNKKDGDFINTIAHEGSHAADHVEYQNALIAAAKTDDGSGSDIMAVVNGPLNITHGQSETRAYGVSSVFAEFTLTGSKREPLIDTTSSSLGSTIKLNQTVTDKSVLVGGQQIWNTSWARIDKVDKLREKRGKAIAKGLKKDPRYSSKLNKKLYK